MGRAAQFWLSERTVRLPSWRAVLVAALLFVLGCWIFLAKIHPFLAPTQPSGGDVLVLEGWVPDTGIEWVAKAFADGRYQRIYVSGVPILEGRNLTKFKTTDQIVADSLAATGVDPAAIRPAIIDEEVFGNRTLRMAYRVREVMGGEIPARFDVITEGVHANRSRLTYQKVIPEAEVGVVSIPACDYDPDRWWRTSEGVKRVLVEIISIVYQRVRGFDLPADPLG